MKYLLCLILLAFQLPKTHAAYISKMAGDKVIVTPEAGDKGEFGEIHAGDYFLVINKQGEKIGEIKIVVERENYYGAKILKGTANINDKILPVKKENNVAKNDSTPKTKSRARAHSSNRAWRFGGLLQISSISETLTLTSDTATESVSATGKSIIPTFFLSHHFSDSGIWQLSAEVEKYKTTATPKTINCGSTCETDITFLSTGLSALYSMRVGEHEFSLGPIVKFKMALSKKSTDLDVDTLKMAYSYGLLGQFHYQLSDKTFLPVWASYESSKISSSVKNKSFSIGIGIGQSF